MLVIFFLFFVFSGYLQWHGIVVRGTIDKVKTGSFTESWIFSPRAEQMSLAADGK